MKTTLNLAKITPPRLSHIVERPRLIKRLEQNQDKKLILILGRAAQGKSTLAASYAQRSRIPFSWTNLSPDEADPVNLFHLLVQSCQHALPEADLSTLFSYPAFSMGPRDAIHLYREWTNAVFERLSAPLQIFLDGLDRLPVDAPAMRFLQTLLESVPPGISLIMLSRVVPPLDIQRLKVSRRALVLDNDELAFRAGEVKVFFRKIRGIAFSNRQLKKIHQSSEGWIGGLILLCEHLDRLPEDKKNEYISELSNAQFKTQVFEYFEAEIFSLQPSLIQDFLIKSAMFETVDPGFIEDFTGIEGVEKILHDLNRRNLFVVSVYGRQKGRLFRYHQMFRDFLQAKMASQLDSETRSALFLKAGALLEQKGELEESLKYFIAARAYPEAASAIECIGMDLLQMGRTGDLSKWLQVLPEDLVQVNPWLLFYLSVTRRFGDLQENMASLARALDLFKKKKNMSGYLLSLAHLIEATSLRGRELVPVVDLIQEAEALLQSLKSHQYPYEKALLWTQIGIVYSYQEGDMLRGFHARQQAYLLAKDLGDITLQVNALIFAMQSLAFMGAFSRADKIHLKLDPLINQCVHPELRILYSLFYSQLLILRGDLEEARKPCHWARDEAEERGMIFFYAIGQVIDLMLSVQREQFKKAEEIGQFLSHLTASDDNKILRVDVYNILALNYYFKGDFEKAKASIISSREALLSSGTPLEWHLNWTRIIRVLISSHLQYDAPAEQELSETMGSFETVSNYFLLVQAHFGMALLKSKQARTDEAATHLQAGFEIAREKGYIHFAFLRQADSVRVCRLAIELQVQEAEEYASHLLATRYAARAGPAIERLLQNAEPEIRNKAEEIRRTIHRAGLPRIGIKTLGGFEVLRNGVLIEDKKWQGSQPKLLLKAIVARGPDRVSREILIEDLWPEGSPEASGKNFKVTLHRLRKALDSGTDKTFGSAYIHLKDSFISLDGELCHVDVDRFLSLYENGKIREKNGEIKEALSLYEMAAKLYRGDFLVQDLYTPWADIKRRELRVAYIELLHKTAELYESSGAAIKAIACYKKVVRSDPLSEKAYQRLMILYANRGRRSEALKVYAQCRHALQSGLDTAPDEMTTSIYKKILET